jgi:hypothetical protein
MVAPTATAGVNSATLSWTVPNNEGAAINGYTVSGGGMTCTSAGSTCVVTGLTSGTSYTFTVIATNANGPSASSPASNSVQVLGAPGAPTGVATSNGYSQAIISWTAPVWTGGSPITGYTVNLSGLTCSTTGATTCVVSGLTNDTVVSGTVSASNANGTSGGASVIVIASAAAAHFTSASTGVTSPTTTTSLAITTTAKTAAVAASKAWMTATGLPTGVTFTPGTGTKAATGTLVAVNLASGVYLITLAASNAAGLLTVQNYWLTSMGFLTSPSAQTWTAGTAVSVAATTNDASAIITSSALPAGMTLTSSGGNAIISGTPTKGAAAMTITLKAKDGTKSTTTTFAVAVDAMPTVTVTGTTTRTHLQAFSLTIKTTGSPAATVSISDMPVGLIYSSATGKITGTVTTPGRSTFTVKATNAAGVASASVAITVT